MSIDINNQNSIASLLSHNKDNTTAANTEDIKKSFAKGIKNEKDIKNKLNTKTTAADILLPSSNNISTAQTSKNHFIPANIPTTPLDKNTIVQKLEAVKELTKLQDLQDNNSAHNYNASDLSSITNLIEILLIQAYNTNVKLQSAILVTQNKSITTSLKNNADVSMKQLQQSDIGIKNAADEGYNAAKYSRFAAIGSITSALGSVGQVLANYQQNKSFAPTIFADDDLALEHYRRGNVLSLNPENEQESINLSGIKSLFDQVKDNGTQNSFIDEDRVNEIIDKAENLRKNIKSDKSKDMTNDKIIKDLNDVVAELGLDRCRLVKSKDNTYDSKDINDFIKNVCNKKNAKLEIISSQENALDQNITNLNIDDLTNNQIKDFIRSDKVFEIVGNNTLFKRVSDDHRIYIDIKFNNNIQSIDISVNTTTLGNLKEHINFQLAKNAQNFNEMYGPFNNEQIQQNNAQNVDTLEARRRGYIRRIIDDPKTLEYYNRLRYFKGMSRVLGELGVHAPEDRYNTSAILNKKLEHNEEAKIRSWQSIGGTLNIIGRCIEGYSHLQSAMASSNKTTSDADSQQLAKLNSILQEMNNLLQQGLNLLNSSFNDISSKYSRGLEAVISAAQQVVSPH